MKDTKTYFNIPLLLTGSAYYWWRIVIVQFLLFLISISVFFDAPDTISLTNERIYAWLGYYFSINLLVYTNVYLLYPRYLAKGRFFLYLFGAICSTLIVLMMMLVLQELFYDIAVTKHSSSVIEIILSVLSSALSILLFLCGISAFQLFKEWLTLNDELSEMRMLNYRSEIDFLKSQINPHFLFNMINNVKILIELEPQKAGKVIEKLDQLTSYQSNVASLELVSFAAEMEFLNAFLALEKTRRDNFDYYVDVKGNIAHVNLPPFLFIPFVENAVKHSNDPSGSIVHLDFEISDTMLYFACGNTKSRISTVHDVGGIGLLNIKRRLKLLYEENYELLIDDRHNYYHIALKIKLK